MFLIAVVSAIFALSNADPLGCCMPARYSGMIQEVGGIVKTATTGDVIDVNNASYLVITILNSRPIFSLISVFFTSIYFDDYHFYIKGFQTHIVS